MSLPTGYAKRRNLTHVFPSLAASLGATSENTLNLPSARSAVLLLVDGLGLEQLQRHSAHAPFLRGVMKRQTPAQTEMSSVPPWSRGTPKTFLFDASSNRNVFGVPLDHGGRPVLAGHRVRAGGTWSGRL